MLKKLRELADLLHKRDTQLADKQAALDDERLAKMQEIEERIRAAFQPRDINLRSVTLMSTEEEFTELIDFLENFEDIMPVAMHRLLLGARAATGATTV
jgi:transcriptional/translational regulatory protein YebC/TACO1